MKKNSHMLTKTHERFKEVIKAICEKQNLSQTDIANALKVVPSTISNNVNGKTRIVAPILVYALQSLYSIDPQYVFGDAKKIFINEDHEDIFCRKCGQPIDLIKSYTEIKTEIVELQDHVNLLTLRIKTLEDELRAKNHDELFLTTAKQA